MDGCLRNSSFPNTIWSSWYPRIRYSESRSRESTYWSWSGSDDRSQCPWTINATGRRFSSTRSYTNWAITSNDCTWCSRSSERRTYFSWNSPPWSICSFSSYKISNRRNFSSFGCSSSRYSWIFRNQICS